MEPDYTPVESIAEEAFIGIRENRFWILPESTRTDARFGVGRPMLDRFNPDYMERML
jgi:hypothetical protein